jgi:hypothetical protein
MESLINGIHIWGKYSPRAGQNTGQILVKNIFKPFENPSQTSIG